MHAQARRGVQRLDETAARQGEHLDEQLLDGARNLGYAARCGRRRSQAPRTSRPARAPPPSPCGARRACRTASRPNTSPGACTAKVATSPSGVVTRAANLPRVTRCRLSPGSPSWNTTSPRLKVRRRPAWRSSFSGTPAKTSTGTSRLYPCVTSVTQRACALARCSAPSRTDLGVRADQRLRERGGSTEMATWTAAPRPPLLSRSRAAPRRGRLAQAMAPRSHARDPARPRPRSGQQDQRRSTQHCCRRCSTPRRIGGAGAQSMGAGGAQLPQGLHAPC